MLRAYDGRWVRPLGRQGDHGLVGGEWVNTAPLSDHPDVEVGALALGGVLRALPRWGLVDGLNLDRFTPDPHQVIPMDMLASGWLERFGLPPSEHTRRTRILVADEGGTGKTLSVSLAVRWALTSAGGLNGALVLVPPLLVDHWVQHLQAVFEDDPGRVVGLGSARYYDPRRHAREVVVVSKFSWSHHATKNPARFEGAHPTVLVVDEIHQGRTSDGGEDGVEDDTFEGVCVDEVEGNASSDRERRNLRTEVRRLAAVATFALGVSATPINTNVDEIVERLQDLHAEGGDEGFGADEAWTNARNSVLSFCRTHDDPTAQVPHEVLKPLIDGLRRPSCPLPLSEEMRLHLATNIEAMHVDIPAGLLLARELHPLGRHLCMTMRSDMPVDVVQRFRRRFERRICVPMSDSVEALYGNEIVRNGGAVNLNRLGTEARILHSQPSNYLRVNTEDQVDRYGGLWRDGGGHPLPNEWEVIDARFDVLLRLAEEDVRHDENARPRHRGMVVFTDFLGTVSWLTSMLEQGRFEGLHGEVRCEVMRLSGETTHDEARRLLNRCRNVSRDPRHYPILIATKAGEVGIDMEWASILVHWDPHPNPQTMEQRTWRLDRRLPDNNTSVRESYQVVHLHTNHAFFEHYSGVINGRHRAASQALGLDRGDMGAYVPVDDGLEDRSHRGSNTAASNANQEVEDLLLLLHGEGGAMASPITERSATSERCFAAAVFHAAGVGGDQMVDEGAMDLPRVGNTERFIRDLEVVDPILSARLGRRRGEADDSIRTLPRWSPEPQEGNARRLHGLRSTAAKMTAYRRMEQIPVVRVRGGPSGHLGVHASLWMDDVARSLPGEDMGLRWRSNEGVVLPVSLSAEGDADVWSILPLVVASLLRGAFDHEPMPESGDDPAARAVAHLRARALHERSDDASRHATHLRDRSEEAGEERKRDRLAKAADIAQEQAQAASSAAERLEAMDHSIAWVCRVRGDGT